MTHPDRAVARSLPGRRFETTVGRHRFLTDHAGLGPTPPDLFAASLAGCIAVYVASYCRKAGLDDAGLEVELAWQRDDERMFDFRTTVRLPAAVVGPRAAAIRRVANRCLVHETVRQFGRVTVDIEDASADAA